MVTMHSIRAGRGQLLIRALPLLWVAIGAASPGAMEPAKPAGSAGQSPAASRLTERATVELVLIEVYVTDSRGRPVEGLTENDFSLMIDGHSKPIHSLEFREVQRGAPPTLAGQMSPDIHPPALAPANLPRRFVLFFEDSTSATEGLTQARKAAQRFLDTGLQPTDQVALVSFDRKLRLLHDFTTDRAALKQTLETDLDNLKRFSDYALEQGQWERQIAEVLSPSSMDSLAPEQVRHLSSNYADEFTPKSRDVLRALTTVVDALSPYPGYKAIVFMGDGVPENPAADFLQRFGPNAITASFLQQARKYDLSQDVQMLARAASAADVTMHSVQTSGATTATGAEMRASGRRSNTLETLALNTGGTKSTSNDLLKGLNEAESAARAYYLIGYSPEDPPDGLYHTVQVRLKHGSGALRWRRGFTRFLPDQVRQRTIEAAYLLPDLYTDLGLEISAVPGPAGGATRVYDLVLHVPPGRSLFVPNPGGATADLESGFVVMDAAHRETLRAARAARVTLGEGAPQDRPGLDFYSRIRVSLDAQTITAVVSDRTAGTFGAARLSLPATTDSRARTVLGLSTYSLTEKSLWIEIPVNGPPAPPGEQSAEYAVGPALKTTFALGEPVACGFRLEGDFPAGDLRISIRHGEREVRSIDLSAEGGGAADEGGPGHGLFKVSLPVDGLDTGDYRIVVRRRDPAGTEEDAGAAPLFLRARSATSGAGAEKGS
jgi:VWFA-related protein